MKRSALILPTLAMLASCAYSPTTIGRSFDFSYSEPTSSTYAKKHSLNILYIGNSFTYYNNIDEVTVGIGESMGLEVKAKKFAVGSQKLAQSASTSDALGAEIDADLHAHDDYTDVILQEQSTTPINSYSSFLTGAVKLKKKVDATQIAADVHLYATWSFPGMTGYAEDLVGGCAALKEAYRKAGAVMEVGVDYVGSAFLHVIKNHPDINLYWSDNKHPSFAGTFLAAAVHLACLSDGDVRTATFHGSESTKWEGQACYITEANAKILLSVAHDVANGAI